MAVAAAAEEVLLIVLQLLILLLVLLLVLSLLFSVGLGVEYMGGGSDDKGASKGGENEEDRAIAVVVVLDTDDGETPLVLVVCPLLMPAEGRFELSVLLVTGAVFGPFWNEFSRLKALTRKSVWPLLRRIWASVVM